MEKANKNLIRWCDDIMKAIKPVELDKKLTGEISELRNLIEQQELLVSVIGAFSAGKSTLINRIIGNNVLPTAITPETSLATELRYSSEQRIEAVKEDGSMVRFDLGDMEKITDNAAKFSHACLYLDNQQIRDLEPLILVDMPGFDSPLDAHNKAIMTYIHRASYYLVLASVQEGTVSKSLLRRIREINQLDRGMSFFLTKADLKPKSDSNDLVKHFTELLEDELGYTGKVVAISQASPDTVMKLLASIDAENLFCRLYRAPVKLLENELIDAINVKKSALMNDKSSFAAAVVELEKTLDKLNKQSQEEIESLSNRQAGGIGNKILNDVGRALEGSLNELISIAKGGDSAATERCLVDVVRTELSISINEHLGAANKEIVTNLSGSLSSLDKVMRDLEINSDFTKKLADVIGSQLTSYDIGSVVSKGAGKIAPILASQFVGVGAKTMGLTLTLGSIINPLLGVVLAFLPEILGWLFSSSNEAKKDEKLRSVFLGQAFPQIKTKLRPELQKIVSESMHEMIECVRVQYEAKISQTKTEFEAKTREKEISAAEKEKSILQLEEARDAVIAITNSLLASCN